MVERGFQSGTPGRRNFLRNLAIASFVGAGLLVVSAVSTWTASPLIGTAILSTIGLMNLIGWLVTQPSQVRVTLKARVLLDCVVFFLMTVVLLIFAALAWGAPFGNHLLIAASVTGLIGLICLIRWLCTCSQKPGSTSAVPHDSPSENYSQ